MANSRAFAIHLVLLVTGFALITAVAIGFTPSSVWASIDAESATIESVKSGNWSDPSVWSSGAVPKEGDAVTINAGHKVVYDVAADSVLGQITIKGELYFSRDLNTRLKVGNHILVQQDGYLNMGTPGDYLPKNVKAELTFVLTEEQANGFVGVSGKGDNSHHHDGSSDFHSPDIGLWVFEQGRWDVHGSPLVRTWSKLAEDVLPGDQSVVVENNVSDWYVGGKVIVTSTRIPREYFTKEDGKEEYRTSIEHELRVIEALEVLENGHTRVTFDEPLAYSHSGTAPFQGEVALLTRNILVSTEIVGVETSAYRDVRNRKFAHTVYMPGARGNLQYGEFRRLGHYGKLGRYALHLHRMLETSRGMIVGGNAIWDTGFRCLNLHITHGVLVEDNVCYNSSSTAFFVEMDDRKEDEKTGYKRGYNEDNVFVHNISIAPVPKYYQDHDSSIAGELHRLGSFWPGSETTHEAYLGNVAVGGKEYTDGGGFSLPEQGNKVYLSEGEIPFTFVHNEVHSSAIHGIISWQTTNTKRDFVGTRIWRNGDAGINWGAYRMSAFYFNTQLLENGKTGIEATSVNAFLQDSIVTGTQVDGSRRNVGLLIKDYIYAQYPNPSVWIVRNVFKDLESNGIYQPQKTVENDNVDGKECDYTYFDPGAPFDLKERPVFPGDCSAVYVTMMGNRFENVKNPMKFGHPANPNSWWKVFDHSGNETDLEDFVLVRSDQDQEDRQGVITEKLVTGDAAFDPDFEALVIPMDSLPAEGIKFTGLLNHQLVDEQRRAPSADFVFTTQPDYPPTVSLDVTINGDTATMKATAEDDGGVTRLEFFVDWVKVATQEMSPTPGVAPSQEVTVDLSNHPRKYAYLYVRAFDGVQQVGDYEQRAYSNVVEIGPEILQLSEQIEAPQGPESQSPHFSTTLMLPSIKS